MRCPCSRHVVIACVLPVAAAILAAGERAGAAPLPIDDASLVRQMPGAGIEYRLPERVFPPDLVARLRGEDAVYRKFLYRSIPQDAPKWTGIPLERWRDLISEIAPVSCEGNTGNLSTMGLSPFTGKLFSGAEMSDAEFLNTPFQCREAGTEFVIYEREADMPADYPARPNHTERIPHLDGSLHEYRFFVAEKFRDAGPEVGSDRKNWFCPAGEVWRCRLSIIMARVIPDLTAAVVLNDDTKAVSTLAAVLDRLADVYPGLPVYGGAKAHGFARGPDRKSYMTAEQYRAIAAKQPFTNVRDRADYPFWYVDIYDFSFDKLHGGVSAWTDGVMDQMGWVAAAFDLIRDRPETLAFSQSRYGATDAWEKRFRERCLKELEFLALATPPTTGNTSYAYITGAVKAGIACQNAALFRKGLEIIELYLYSNWSPDGMAADAAFNYAMMTQSGILGLSWLNPFFGGVDLAARYPLKRTIDRLGIDPIGTLYGITSKHADEHSLIFRGAGPGPDPTTLPYGEHEASQCLPFYGMTALRGGAPGRRLELILNHQNAAQHAHLDRLTYQLFYEGVDCLPDFGYCIGYIDPQKPPWSEVRTAYELLGLPNEDTDRWGPWKWGYADRPEAHGVLMVDHWLYEAVPCQLRAYAGATAMSDPGWWAQVADASAAGLFVDRPNPVDIYQRQVALLTLPGGSPVVLDLFRVRGGARHDLFWLVPADRPRDLPSAGEPIAAPNWAVYQGTNTSYDKLTGKAIYHYGMAGRLITGLTRHALPATPWHNEWLIQPSRTFPEPEARRADWGNWPKLLHDVRLGLWSYAAGSTSKGEVVWGRGPYPGGLPISDPASGKTLTATVGLKEALDVRVLTRQAEQPGLESIFLGALEARRPEQPAELAGFAVEATQALAAGGGVVCRLALADGTSGVFASTLNGEAVETPTVALRGRLAALFARACRLTLVDGTAFRADGWQLDLEPGWEMPLASVVGDLTGQPQESALVVDSARPLPTDGTLTGHLVYVWHQGSPHGQSVYTIAKVSRRDDNRWRLDLADGPPFITQRARVLTIDPADPRKLEQDFQFHHLMNQRNVTGRRIRFLRSGFETVLAETGRSTFSVVDAPPAGAVSKGDPFVVYSVQTGDRVTIPSRFACTGAVGPDGTLSLRLASTGAARLTLPGTFRQVTAGATPLATQSGGDQTTVRLEAAHLSNGRAVIQFSP
jgi:hypothetical protein